MNEDIDRKIESWAKPKYTNIGGIKARDIHEERLNPLQLDSRELHTYLVKERKTSES